MRDLVVFGVPSDVDFAPSTVVEEVLQNVRTILCTARWSVPLDREFGLDASMLDRPTPDAMAALSSEIYTKIRKYEPRCHIVRIAFDGDLDGRLVPKVTVRVHDQSGDAA